ncbi:MAG: argininosuccinate lyase [Candidatus Xenobiia bacterium LiM19]
MKLWDKGKSLDDTVERFTVGEDYIHDVKLLPYDCIASAAHAKALHRSGIISSEELEMLESALGEIQKEGLIIRREHEDVHTAIEERLIERLGDLGKKLHTGRSRNDQIMVDLQLWARDELKGVYGSALSLCRHLNERAGTEPVLMAGYTHMQRAMPSSIQLLLGSYIESLLDDLDLLSAVKNIGNKNPLGSAAGYGSSLRLDREFTSQLLGFNGVRNSIYVQARARHMALYLFPLMSVMKSLDRMASDLLLFTMSEFNFFSLPDTLCTGSSIMPQKKNYDLLELIRAKSAELHGLAHSVDMMGYRLTSGYHRDFQLTKGPVMKSFEMAEESLEIMGMVIANLRINREALDASLSAELFATDRAYQLVREGIPFRNAYKEVASSLDELCVPADPLAGREFLSFRDYRVEIEEKEAVYEGW